MLDGLSTHYILNLNLMTDNGHDFDHPMPGTVEHDLMKLARLVDARPNYRHLDLLAGVALRYGLQAEGEDAVELLGRTRALPGLGGVVITRLDQMRLKWSSPDAPWYQRWSERDRPIKWDRVILPNLA